MTTTHPLLVLQLHGSQAEMGRQHGAMIARHGGFHKTMEYYPQLPLRILSSGGRSVAEQTMLMALKPVFRWAMRRMEADRPEDLVARSRAFSTALGRHRDEAQFISVMDIFQNTVGLLARSGMMGAARRTAMAVPPACSTLMAWGEATEDGRLLHARNFDFPGIGLWEAQPVLAFCAPTRGLRYGFATTRGADTPGVTAFNEAGLTLTAHTRFHRDVGFGASIVDVGHEIIRSARTLDEAVEIARSRRVASSWGLAVSSASEGSAVVIETTAEGVEVTRPRAGEAFSACTNHYLHPAMQVDEVSPSPAWLQHCLGRYAVLRGRARAGALDVQTLCRLLGSHLDADTGEERAAGGVIAQSVTVQSIVADPERHSLWLSVGDCPTGHNTFAEVPWDWSGATSARVVHTEVGPTHPSRYATGRAAEGFRHYRQACHLDERGATTQVVAEQIELAVGCDPTDSTWRFMAGTLCLRHGQSQAALDHFEVGLVHDHSPFYRGQLLLWGSRAAQAAGHTDRAHTLRRELLSTEHALLTEHRARALSEDRRPPRPDAWRGIPVTLELVDAG